MSDPVDHPKHYAHASKVEAIEICEALGFVIGNAVKYVFRHDAKGAPVEDLRKAAWYLRRALAGHADYAAPSPELVLRVRAAEPEGALLRCVLEALFVTEGLNYHARVRAALERVEREIEVAVSISTQVANNLEAKTEELALCMSCLCNMLEAFDGRKVGAEITARILGRT